MRVPIQRSRSAIFPDFDLPGGQLKVKRLSSENPIK